MTKLLTNNKCYIIFLNESSSQRICLKEVEVDKDFKIINKKHYKMFVVPWAIGGIIVGFASKKDDKESNLKAISDLNLYNRIKRERYTK